MQTDREASMQLYCMHALHSLPVQAPPHQERPSILREPLDAAFVISNTKLFVIRGLPCRQNIHTDPDFCTLDPNDALMSSIGLVPTGLQAAWACGERKSSQWGLRLCQPCRCSVARWQPTPLLPPSRSTCRAHRRRFERPFVDFA